jgi:hypothetical protein
VVLRCDLNCTESPEDTVMEALLASFRELFFALTQFIGVVLQLLAPWTPLAAWLAYWLFAADWSKLWPVLAKGGWIGVVLIGLMMTMIWGVIAPPTGGHHVILGLTLSNFVGKFVYVTALLVMMTVCGTVQLSGACGDWASFPEPEPEDDGHHGHVDHGHGHDAHHAAAHAH